MGNTKKKDGGKKEGGAGGVKEDEERTCRACNPANPNHMTYSFDRRLNEDESPDLKCDSCHNYYHPRCVALEPYMPNVIGTYKCPKCFGEEPGQFTERIVVCEHRRKYDDASEMNLPIEVATKKWMEDLFPGILEKIPIPPSEMKGAHKIHVLKDGKAFASRFMKSKEWKDLYLIDKKDDLGIVVPPHPFGIDDVIKIMGKGVLVDVVDVHTQQAAMMYLETFRKKMREKKRRRLYNILSLEFTESKMKSMVTPPTIYQELSLQEKLFNTKKRLELLKGKGYSHVGRFCLLSMGGSFTDFHIDFGGSSVFYHVHSGKKIFFVVPPTAKNLQIFEEFQMEGSSSEFLGEVYLRMNQIWKVEIEEGMTALMPSGWIHAVYTPVDSVVFGGNFLTASSMKMQLEIRASEERLETVETALYPNFDLIVWLAAEQTAEELKGMTSDKYHLFHFPNEENQMNRCAYLNDTEYQELKELFELGEQKLLLWPHDSPPIEYVARLIASGPWSEIIALKKDLFYKRRTLKSLELMFTPPLDPEFDVDVDEEEEDVAEKKTDKEMWDQCMKDKVNKAEVRRLNSSLALYDQIVDWSKRDEQEKREPPVKNYKAIIADLERELLRITGLKKLPKAEYIMDRQKMEKLIVELKMEDEEEEKKKKKEEEEEEAMKKNSSEKGKKENASDQGTVPKKARRNDSTTSPLAERTESANKK